MEDKAQNVFAKTAVNDLTEFHLFLVKAIDITAYTR